jgi:hypothetical protein
MKHSSTITGDQLVNALASLGVKFILGGYQDETRLQKQPIRLLTALAESSEARLRLSLIPLLLDHPEFAKHVRRAAKDLDAPERLTLICYYSAAVWLQRKHQPEAISLPDYFSKELGMMPAENPDDNLRQLAQRHAEISGAHLNWLGTYQHAAQIWLKGRHG